MQLLVKNVLLYNFINEVIKVHKKKNSLLKFRYKDLLLNIKLNLFCFQK